MPDDIASVPVPIGKGTDIFLLSYFSRLNNMLLFFNILSMSASSYFKAAAPKLSGSMDWTEQQWGWQQWGGGKGWLCTHNLILRVHK